MELQPIAEESAKAAATSQQQASAAETAAHHLRKLCIACGKRSESENSDTAMLVAFAVRRLLRPSDLISVIHVSELPPLVMCAARHPACSAPSCMQREHGARFSREHARHLRASGGRKHATHYKHSESEWPAWMPTPLKAWHEQDNLTAYELHASGSAAESIVDFVATELKPDLLVVGNRPRGTMARMFTAGVSSAVVEYADVPTLIVRGVAAPLQLEGAERRVAICLDGSTQCRKIVEWAAKTLLSPATDDVYLLHSPAGLEASQLLPAMGNIQSCRSFLLAQGFAERSVSPVELDFHTDACDSIIDFLEADTKPFEICVCGSRGLKGSLTRFLLGSLTRYLLLYAPCSLLVLPPAALGEAGEGGPAE